MRFISTSLFMMAMCACSVLAQVNPNTQINWPEATGVGAPGATCPGTPPSGAALGTPYLNTASNTSYVCSASGWITVGGGGSGLPAGGLNGAVILNTGTSTPAWSPSGGTFSVTGFNIFQDSLGLGYGTQYNPGMNPTNPTGFSYKLAQIIGNNGMQNSVSGDQLADMWLREASNISFASNGNLPIVGMYGVNDANLLGTSSGGEANYSAELLAKTVYETTPGSRLVTGANYLGAVATGGTIAAGGSISVTGASGTQVCLTGFNNSSTATAYAQLTALNTLGTGAALFVVNSGSGATSAPTTATVSLTGCGSLTNPATAASGSANVTTTLQTGPCVVNTGTVATGTFGLITTISLQSPSAKVTCTTLPSGTATASSVVVGNVVLYNGTQTGTIAVDGGTPVTVDNYGFLSQTVGTANNPTQSTVFGTLFTGLTPAASHSVVITNGSGGGTTDIAFIAQQLGNTPTNIGNQSVTPPISFIGETIRQKNDANSAATAYYATLNQTIANEVQQDMNTQTYFCPMRTFVDVDYATTDCDMEACNKPNQAVTYAAATPGGAGLHPNQSGHDHMYEAFLACMRPVLRINDVQSSNALAINTGSHTVNATDGFLQLLGSSAGLTFPTANTIQGGVDRQYTVCNTGSTGTAIAVATNNKNVPLNLRPQECITTKSTGGTLSPLNYGAWYMVARNMGLINNATRYPSGTTDTLVASDGLVVLNNASGTTETIPTPSSLGLSNAYNQTYQIFVESGTWTFAGATILGSPTSGGSGSIGPNTAIMFTPISGTTWAMTNFTATAGTGTLTNFAAPSVSWPSWLVPTVINATTAPSLSVASSLTLANIGAGVATGGGTFDFSGSVLKPTVSAGFTATGGKIFGYDSTYGNWHFNVNGGDVFGAMFSVSAPPTSGHCAAFNNNSGTWLLLDGGGPCTVRGTGTYTTATSDAFTITGVTASSYCIFSPTNSTAAASTVAGYVSSVTTNSVTISHVATTASTGTVNIICTTN